MLTLLLVIFLPLLEIAGFIIIGGEIGIGKSLLWVIASTIGGFYLLTTMGSATMAKARQSVDADIYPFEEMFDGFCILIGSLLLIFPGFISDFLALPLLLTPSRKMIFRFLKSQHESVLENFTKNAEGFSYWYSEKTHSPQGSPTIEGEFTVIENKDNDKKLD